ncbi:MAG: midcut-by-XrtH protein [Burkholderiales bacterium]|nr:MAG: midcut-by-XrtH protein [Betaproteobacteria bacterium]TAG84560.1 MAG: midcut-by-XrtH protein [Burkholderiales bacterium]
MSRSWMLTPVVVLSAFSTSLSHGQTITTTALATSAVPLNRVGALLLLALTMGACVAAQLRWRLFSKSQLRGWLIAGAALLLSAVSFWGDSVRAQLAELQRFFTVATGETLTIPVQATATAADGSPLGFLPVVYTNQTSSPLLISARTPVSWPTCFPLGVPEVLPATTPHAGTPCTVGAAVSPASTCWVDVAQLCIDAANLVRGNQPSLLQADTARVAPGVTLSGNVLTNDSDADGALQVTRFAVGGTTYAAGSTIAAFSLQRDGAFSFSPANPYVGSNPLVVTYAVQTGASSTLTITVNRAPTANNDVASTNVNTPLVIPEATLLLNDTDPENDTLTVQSVQAAVNGAVSRTGGNVTFTPTADFVGAASFTYTISDGSRTSTATVAVTVNAVVVNRAPTANDDTAVTVENAAVTVDVRGNDTDPDGNTLTVSSVSQGANGSVVIDGVTGNPIYTPNAGFTGRDSFTYTISDGFSGTASAMVTVTVNAANRAPTAVNDSVSTAINTQVVIPEAMLLSNDTDPENDTLTVQSVQAAVNGNVVRAGGNVTFTPSNGFEGSGSFTYTITDGVNTSTATVTVAVGSASAPSVVVIKSLLAIAAGTGGVSVRFPITTALVDTDGSEALSIRISGVPTGLTFNAGTNLGGGVWTFVAADLSNLTLNLPGSYTTLATYLTVQVTATEINGGATASTSSVVTLKAAYTTVDVSTTESGSYTGSSANENIFGGNGNNTINAAGGNNIVRGGGGNDPLSAGAGSDVLDGGAGSDTLNSGSGTDILIGGPGDDTMQGGDAGENFVDVFVWRLGDQGATGAPALDTINHFATAAAGSNTSGGDVLDLRDLLQGEAVGPSNGAGNLANYLHFEIVSGNTVIYVSHLGGFAGDSHVVGAGYTTSAETQRITLVGVNLLSLYSGAITDQQIITQLLNNNKLIVD